MRAEWDLVITGGTVVNADGSSRADVGVTGETIGAVAPAVSIGPGK